MPRKQIARPTAGRDPNEPLSAADLDPVDVDFDDEPAAAVALEEPPPASGGKEDNWPAVPWRDHDLAFLRYARGQATGEDVAYIMSRSMDRRAIARECDRVVSVARLLPLIGTAQEMERLQAEEAAERERIGRQRSEEIETFAHVRRQHEARLLALDRELSTISDASGAMARARETVGRMLPDVANQARTQARKTFIDSDAKRELDEARGRLFFLKQAAGLHMLETVDETTGIGKTTATRAITVPARIQHPGWLFDPAHEGYLCDRPDQLPQLAGLTHAQAMSQYLEAQGWEAKRAELASRIPAAQADVDRLAAEYTAASRAVDERCQTFTYLID